MRNRLEDLGRIMQMVKNLSEDPIFDLYQQRPKDFIDWFDQQQESCKEDILHEMAYGIKEIEAKLVEIWEIASGQDFLNEDKEDGI